MNKIVLLDRNVYIEIENKLTGRTYNKQRIRSIKKEYDQYGSSILSLSIIEGEKSEIETPDGKYKVFKKETNFLNKFFKKSKTFQPDLLNNNSINQEFKYLLEDIHPDQTKDFNSIKFFLVEINKILRNNVSTEKYLKIEKDIIDIAIKNELNLYNPIVFCTLLVLYKNQKIRKIYKFGKNYDTKVYNVLSDFNTLKQCAMVKKSHPSIKVEFVTFDGSLKYLSQYLKTELFDNSSDMQYKVTYSSQLLMDSDSNFSEEESSKVFDRINKYYRENSRSQTPNKE